MATPSGTAMTAAMRKPTPKTMLSGAYRTFGYRNHAALEIKRHIGVSYATAWLMHHKLMSAMAARKAQHRLSGTVQVDGAYLGGKHADGTPGRGSESKVPFVAAVCATGPHGIWPG